ncbi:RagB/SusD family nutrient uptake outer membrane protein [Maribacter sp. 2304DJ31-5]|uniref:RagB/SusD family nutrient uptake outer membrane protein n=1 Tax=Maribacter sp. 2304DJ31-5 TaxID=3386273 RepID=UPI0039BC3665
MKNYIVLSVIAIILLFSSCDDYLDVIPKGELIPESIDDYALMLNSVEFYNVPKLHVMIDDDFFTNQPTSLQKPQAAAYLWEDFFYDDTENDPNWGLLYEQVFLANTILKGIEGIESDEKVDQVRAEALFQRSYAFFLLVNLYAKHYNSATASADLGIPLILSPSLEEETYVRNTVEEVYARIIADVEDHVDFLPDVHEDKVRPGKDAAYGFLARVFLYMGEFEKAKEAATNALNLNDSLFDLRTSVAGYPYRFHDYVEGYINKTAFGVPSAFTMDNTTKAEVYTEGTDLRYNGLFFNFVVNSLYRFFALNYTGPSTPEMYLIRAEANARNNNVQEALDDLNEMRKYRFLEADYQEILPSDVDDIFELVQLERRRELMYKGHRWFDVKRLNSEGVWNVSLERRDATGTAIATLPANDNKAVFAIPPKIISEFNTNLQQNPR